MLNPGTAEGTLNLLSDVYAQLGRAVAVNEELGKLNEQLTEKNQALEAKLAESDTAPDEEPQE